MKPLIIYKYPFYKQNKMYSELIKGYDYIIYPRILHRFTKQKGKSKAKHCNFCYSILKPKPN